MLRIYSGLGLGLRKPWSRGWAPSADKECPMCPEPGSIRLDYFSEASNIDRAREILKYHVSRTWKHSFDFPILTISQNHPTLRVQKRFSSIIR